METRILFGHKIRNHRLERLVEEQARSIDKYTYRTARVTVVIDVINNSDKVCHISLQVADDPTVDVCKVRPGVMMAIMSAFEELEERLQHNLIEKTHHDGPETGYRFSIPRSMPFEGNQKPFFMPPRPTTHSYRRVRRH